MELVSKYVREQKRYTKNELKRLFRLDEIGIERFIKNLSGAIKIPTIANRDESLVDWAPFDEFHAFLESSYPLMHEKLEKQIIKHHSTRQGDLKCHLQRRSQNCEKKQI